MSIWFAASLNPSVRYRELDFARRTGWTEVLEAYLPT